jgi:hypothetical protein
MEFLKTIDGLEDFILVDKSDAVGHYAFLDVSSNLRKLSVTVEGGTRDCYPAAVQWTRTVVGKSTRLEQLVPPSTYDWSEISPILQAKGINLKQISRTYASKELLAYLGSYSGLENLTILSERGKEDLAYLFFDSLLQHKDSLLSLVCSAYHEGEWCLTRYNLDIISQLHDLQHLEIAVNSYDIKDDRNIIVSGSLSSSAPFASDIHRVDNVPRHGTRNARPTQHLHTSHIHGVLVLGCLWTEPDCAGTTFPNQG